MRPKSEENKKLKKYLIVRLTQQEKEEIEQRCREELFLSLSDYARSRLFKQRLIKRIVFPADYKNELHTMDYDLVKIGTNLNQIAKRLNAYTTSMLDDNDLKVIWECNKMLKDCFHMLEKYLMYL